MAERRHESDDLEDYEVLDSADTLAAPPGDDPLDRGVATPAHWSAAVRSGGTAEEQEEGESLDELLAEEEPDTGADVYAYEDEEEDVAEFAGLDENAPEDDVDRVLHEDGPDPRAGRLVSEDAEEEYRDGEITADGEAVAYDAGIDSGGATAEEAALHVLGEVEEEDDEDGRRR